MILSKKHNFLYIGLYKTGTTSIHTALINLLNPKARRGANRRVVPIELHDDRDPDAVILHETKAERHLDVRTVKEMYFLEEEQDIWDKLFIFSFVRHPLDLVYSHFKFEKKTTNNILEAIKNDDDKSKALKRMPKHRKKFIDLEFNDWVKQYFDTFSLPPKDKNLVDQYACLSNEDGELMVDNVYKFEDLQGGIDDAFATIGLTPIILPVRNTTTDTGFERPKLDSSTITWKDVYTPETKAIVVERFKRDLEFFEYNF